MQNTRHVLGYTLSISLINIAVRKSDVKVMELKGTKIKEKCLFCNKNIFFIAKKIAQ